MKTFNTIFKTELKLSPRGMEKLANILPLTQGIKLLKSTSLGLESSSVLSPVIVMLATAAICIGISLKFFKWE